MEFIFALIIAVFPACQSEDSSNCYYDAAVQGNGAGSSFLDIDGVTYRSAEDFFGGPELAANDSEVFHV